MSRTLGGSGKETGEPAVAVPDQSRRLDTVVRWLSRLGGRVAERFRRRKYSRRIAPLYRPQTDGVFLLYAGPLVVDPGPNQHVLDGQVEFRLFPKSTLTARFSGPLREYHHVSAGGSLEAEPPLALADSADLTPPAEPKLRGRPPKTSWTSATNWSLPKTVGRLRKAKRFVVHISGPLQIRFPLVVPVREGGDQPQVAFQLPGWNLVLAPHQDERDDDFTAVIKATSVKSHPSEGDVAQLAERLFVLLSLMANREIGIGPICGLSRVGRIVWVEWGTRRGRFGRPGVGWCPLDESAYVLPTLASGLSNVASDRALDAIVDRAINHLLAADGDEVLDVRIPVACSAVELLGWAILQREKGFSRKAVEDLDAWEIADGALRWAGIPAAIPAHFTALEERKNRLSQPAWEGPGVLFSVRNKLVHPPNRVKDPEWPNGDELYEAWALATSYLELLILRVIGYEGNYLPRLDLPRMVSDVEPVPWAPTGP